MASFEALLFQAVFFMAPISTSGSEFLQSLAQMNPGSNSSSEPWVSDDPLEGWANLANTSGFELVSGSMEENSSQYMSGLPDGRPVGKAGGKSSNSSSESGFVAALQEDLAEMSGFEAVNGSFEEDSFSQLSGLSTIEGGTQGSGQHFYAQVCAALNCHRRLPLSNVHNFGEAAVGKSGGSCVVAFRGTASMADVLQDLASYTFVPFGCSGCRVGSGFVSGYHAVAGRIKGALRGLGCHSVAVTGHSLGAAKAILGLYDLAKSGFHITTSYVFGEPRVGNTAFLASFQSVVHASVFQVVHGKDPIVPLGGPGAHHVGRQIYEPGHSRLTDHLHYSGVDMTSCTPHGLPGGAAVEKAGEKVAKKAESAAQCCLHFKWSCCIPR